MGAIPFSSDSRSRSSLEKALSDTITALGGRAGSEAELRTLMAVSETLHQCGLTPLFFERLNREFSISPSRPVHVTGYYLPELGGSLTMTEKYRFPVYSKPEGDLPLRAEIDQQGALAGRGLEIAWVSDAVDLFFLHIQGSGILRLDDGTTRMLLYAGNNGAEYHAIGKTLIERGEIDSRRASMQVIKEYLKDNPRKTTEILNLNQRYVFYRLGEETAYTTLGTPVTPMRTIAADWNVVAPGSIAFLHGNGSLPECLVINQDTGSAIKDDRIDLFTGSGEEAETLAGNLNERTLISLISTR